MNNEQRALRAKAILCQYGDMTKLDFIDTQSIDLLTDIMHLCKRHRLSFNQILSTAKAHFAEETTQLAKHK